MAWNWHKTHSGASLIIGMLLSVLILTFSLNMAQTIKSTQGNIQQSLKAGDLEAAQEAAEQKAEALAAEGINPFDTTVPVDDYRFVVAVDGQKVEKDVWVSTGCPVPSTSNEDFGDAMDANTMFPIYNEEGESTPVRLLEHCYGEDYTLSNNYYVYPTAVVYDGTAEKSNLVASDCEPNQLYDSYNGTPLNPLDHPCYWGKLEPGESVRIPLNKFGWSLADISNLKLRLRTTCESGAEWCTDSGRVTYDEEIDWDSIRIDTIDNSSTLATWVLEVDSGILNYSSSKGDSDTLRLLGCNNQEVCRDAYQHSEITKYRMHNGSYTLNDTNNYFDFEWLASTDFFGDVLQVIDLSTNESPSELQGFGANLLDHFKNMVDPNELIFQINNTTRKNVYGETLEYQILSNTKIPKK